jgi:hypothetical protein
MYQGKKIVVVTPAGRKAYLEILFKYILSLKSVVDEYRLWVNTTNKDDINYMIEFQSKNSEYVTLEYLPHDINADSIKTIRHFFRNCCEPNTIYVRFDDDIVCMQGVDDFLNFLNFRISHPEYFLVYANIINNSIISHIHQRNGNLDLTCGIAGYACMDNIGWNNSNFAKNIHMQVIKNNCDLSLYKMDNWILYHYERVSINCVSWFGEEFAQFHGTVHGDEEEYISCVKPREIKKMNVIYGGFVCVHYAFFTQRQELDKDSSILQAYLNKSNFLG